MLVFLFGNFRVKILKNIFVFLRIYIFFVGEIKFFCLKFFNENDFV